MKRPVATPGMRVALYSGQFNLKVIFPLHGPIENALARIKPDSFQVGVEIPTPQNVQTLDLDTQEFGGPLLAIKQSMFGGFFEGHRSWLEDQWKDPSRHPEILRFARTVRNACAHGGKLVMKAGAAPVTWEGITYRPEMSGRTVVGDDPADLWDADLILLLLDLSETLDGLGAPVR